MKCCLGERGKKVNRLGRVDCRVQIGKSHRKIQRKRTSVLSLKTIKGQVAIE